MSDLSNIDNNILDDIRRLQETFDALGVPMPPIPEKSYYQSNKGYEIHLKAWCSLQNEKLYKKLNNFSDTDVVEEQDDETSDSTRQITDDFNRASADLKKNNIIPSWGEDKTDTPELQQPEEPMQEHRMKKVTELLRQAVSNIKEAFSILFTYDVTERIKNIFRYVGYVLLMILIPAALICAIVGAVTIYSGIRSCSNETENAQNLSTMSQIANIPIQEGPTAYVCTGSGSKRFHQDRNCYGLNSCTEAVMRITAYEADRQGYTPCKRCYNQIERQQIEQQIQEWKESK